MTKKKKSILSDQRFIVLLVIMFILHLMIFTMMQNLLLTELHSR